MFKKKNMTNIIENKRKPTHNFLIENTNDAFQIGLLFFFFRIIDKRLFSYVII